MQPIRTFNVSPSLPARLEPLRKLAYNLLWDWNVETKDLFRRLDPDLWESSRHNPVLMLGTISQARLLEVVEDEGFLAQMDRAALQIEDYLKERTWYEKTRDKGSGTKNWGQGSNSSVSSFPNSQSPIPNTRSPECYAYFLLSLDLWTVCLSIQGAWVYSLEII